MKYILEVDITESKYHLTYAKTIFFISGLSLSETNNIVKSNLGRRIKIETSDDTLRSKMRIGDYDIYVSSKITTYLKDKLEFLSNLGLEYNFYSVVDKREDKFKELFK